MDRQKHAPRPSEGPAIGGFVRSYRVNAHLTTREVSDASGVPVQSIEEIEAGTRVTSWPVTEQILDAIAAAFMRQKGLAS